MSGKMTRRDFLRLSALVALEGAALSFAPIRLAQAATQTGSAAAVLDAPAAGDMAFLSAEEQIRRFKSGDITPLDVLEAQIERIKKYNGPLNLSGDEPKDFMSFNGMLNAITYEHYDEARRAAEEAGKRYKAGAARALEGITVAVKDETDVKGWRVTMGTVPLKDAPLSEDDGAIIDKLRAEGAIFHIQTTVPELYLHVQTWSRLWGVTRNPWNMHYATGGSSGGSGAALAAGFTTLATGSDMGGSIRIPASLCGLYGFKPPFGRVPTSEISFETLGPMARTFGDMTMMQNVISGPHPLVHASLRPKLDYPQRYDSLKGVKIALDYFNGWLPSGLDDSVRKAMADAADVLRAQGAVIEEVDLGWQYKDIFPVFIEGLLSTAMGEMLISAKDNKDRMTTYAAQLLDTMTDKGALERAKSDDLATELHQQVQREVFGKGCQALIMPTLMTHSFPADNDPTKDTVIINGVPVKGNGFALTYPWNLLNRYPVVDAPIGISPTRVPIGMQIVGNTFDDLAAYRVAYAYSRAGLNLYQGDLFPDCRSKP